MKTRVDTKLRKPVQIRMSESQYDKLCQYASESDMNPSEYIRFQLFERDWTDPEGNCRGK